MDPESWLTYTDVKFMKAWSQLGHLTGNLVNFCYGEFSSQEDLSPVDLSPGHVFRD